MTIETMDEQIKVLLSREAELSKLIPELEHSALDHETNARKARTDRDVLKREREQIRQALTQARVVQRTITAEQAAIKAQKDAEEALKRLAEKEKALDELIAAKKNEPTEAPPSN